MEDSLKYRKTKVAQEPNWNFPANHPVEAPPLSIKPARNNDIPGICEIDKLCRLPEWTSASYASCIKDKRADFLVATLQDDFSGAVGFYVARTLNRKLEILKIAVRPRDQGRGIGQQLLTEGLERGSGRQAQECLLEVRPTNRTAVDLYRRNGFRVITVHRNYYRAPCEDALVMVRGFRMTGQART